MLSSFFSKSKPINFTIVSIYILLMYVIVHLNIGISFTLTAILNLILGMVILWFTMVIVNKLAKSNELIGKSTYVMLLFTSYTFLIYDVVAYPVVLGVNFLIVAAMHNIFALKKQTAVKQRILNASLCIGLATIIDFWSIIFILPLYIGMVIFIAPNYRNVLIPIIGFLAVYVLTTCVTLQGSSEFFTIQRWYQDYSLKNTLFFTANNFWITIVMMISIVLFLIAFMIKYNRSSTKIKPSMVMLVIYLMIACIIPFISNQKTSIQFIFLIPPLAIMGASFFEFKIKKIIKEVGLWLFLITPILLQILKIL
ncbi:DUF6427 family protein [Aquimarina rhabdastrellae]